MSYTARHGFPGYICVSIRTGFSLAGGLSYLSCRRFYDKTPSSTNPDIQTFDFEEILYIQDLLSSGNVNRIPIFHNIYYDSKYQLPSFESGELDLAFSAG